MKRIGEMNRRELLSELGRWMKKVEDQQKTIVERNFNRFRKNSFGDYSGEIWGEITYDGVYIIKSVFDKEMADAGFNSTAFLSWAKRNGLIECEQGRTTKRHRINGTQTRCICILKEGETWAASKNVTTETSRDQ